MLKMIEGFDHFTGGVATTVGSYPVLLTTKNWNFIMPTGSSVGGELTTGRVDGRCFHWSANTGGINGECEAYKLFPAALTTLSVGFALQRDSFAAGPFGANVFIILRAGGSDVIRLRHNSGGQLLVYNSSDSLIATGSFAMTSSAWHYIELKILVNGASSTLETQLNGGPDIPVFTTNLGSSGIDRIVLYAHRRDGTFPNGTNLFYDDIYVCDGSAPNTGFLGDCHIITIYPASDGTHQQWTPNSGTAHYSRVNEHSPDDDTSYVSDNNTGDRDSYHLDTLVGVGAVKGLQINQYSRKFDSGSRSITPIIRRSGTTYSGTVQALSTSYVDHTQLYDTDPSTSAAWTVAGINAGEFGSEAA